MIRAHDLGVRGEREIAAAARALGLDGVQLVVYKAVDDVKYEQGSITKERAEKIACALSEGGVGVALIGAYFNPVHPNREKAERGIRIFEEYLSMCSSLGCDTVGSETGSYMGDPWGYHPGNLTDEAFDRVVEVFSGLAEVAEGYGANIAVEGAYNHVCSTPKRLAECVARIGRENVRVIFDLYNYLNIENHGRAYEILDEGLELFGEKITLFHIKDYTVDGDRLSQCGVGKGILDYKRIIAKIFRHNPNATLVLEGTVGEDIAYSVRHLGKIISETENTLA